MFKSSEASEDFVIEGLDVESVVYFEDFLALVSPAANHDGRLLPNRIVYYISLFLSIHHALTSKVGHLTRAAGRLEEEGSTTKPTCLSLLGTTGDPFSIQEKIVLNFHSGTKIEKICYFF